MGGVGNKGRRGLGEEGCSCSQGHCRQTTSYSRLGTFGLDAESRDEGRRVCRGTGYGSRGVSRGRLSGTIFHGDTQAAAATAAGPFGTTSDDAAE